jgi:DNA mismatch repair ATPase MutS
MHSPKNGECEQLHSVIFFARLNIQILISIFCTAQERFDMVLFFKKGKFYEMFEGDADIGHSKLHLKLTDRTNMRMCGIPEGRFAQYANQLVAMGYKVCTSRSLHSRSSSTKVAKAITPMLNSDFAWHLGSRRSWN